jgi:hypothetical protein
MLYISLAGSIKITAQFSIEIRICGPENQKID